MPDQRSGRQGRADGPQRGNPHLTEGISDRNDRGQGIDRLSLSFPLRSAVQWDRLQTVTTSTGRTSGSSVIDADGFGVFVGAMEADGAAIPWGKVEMNPARLHDPDGCSLASVEDMREAAEIAMDVASDLLDPACPAEATNVKRLDVARDFGGVSRPALYVHGLRSIRRPYARRVAVYSDPGRGNVQTLTVGSGAGMVRLYDQHEAYAERGAPEGSLRWECEARSDWMAAHGVRALGDVTAERVDELARYRWKWSACGLEVAGVDQVIEKVIRSDLSPARQQRLLGVLMLKARGHAAPMGAVQEREYERYIRDLGVMLTPGDLESAGETVRARLDFDSGREVLSVAA